MDKVKSWQFASDAVGCVGGYLMFRLSSGNNDWLFALSLLLSLVSVTFETGMYVRVIQTIALFIGIISAWATTPDSLNLGWLIATAGIVLIVVNASQMIEKIASWISKAAKFVSDFIEELRDKSPA